MLVTLTTLLPALMPLVPAAIVSTRIAEQIAVVPAAHGAPPTVVNEELQQMGPCRFARTANLSVVGVLTEFTHLAEVYRDSNPGLDLDLVLRLARTPCSPLYRKNISPDRELAALLRSITS